MAGKAKKNQSSLQYKGTPKKKKGASQIRTSGVVALPETDAHAEIEEGI